MPGKNISIVDRQWDRVMSAVRHVERSRPMEGQKAGTIRPQLVKFLEENDNGFWSGKLYATDAANQAIIERGNVWLWPLNGGEPSTTIYHEANQALDQIDGIPVFRVVEPGSDDFPSILRIQTKLCKIGAKSSFTILAAADQVVDVERAGGVGGVPIVSGNYNAEKGTVKIKCTMVWTDPDYVAYAEEFGFLLLVDSTEYTGAPTYTPIYSGPDAKKIIEFTWEVSFANKAIVSLILLAYRLPTYFHSLVGSSESLIFVDAAAGKDRVEMRQITLPVGVLVGPKVCIDEPQGCCDDDQTSFTSSNTSSKSPFPLLWTAAGTTNCATLMGWRGNEIDGVYGSAPVAIAARYKVTLPTFTPQAFTVPPRDMDGTGQYFFPAYFVPPLDARFASFLSGLSVILETGTGIYSVEIPPDHLGYPGVYWRGEEPGNTQNSGLRTFYGRQEDGQQTSGSCGYDNTTFGEQGSELVIPGSPLLHEYDYIRYRPDLFLGITWAWDFPPASGVTRRRPVLHLGQGGPGGYAIQTMYQWYGALTSDFFFDTSAPLAGFNEGQNMYYPLVVHEHYGGDVLSVPGGSTLQYDGYLNPIYGQPQYTQDPRVRGYTVSGTVTIEPY